MCEEQDGFFVFFAECWRVMKPDALIYLRAPYGYNIPALDEPTHTRPITVRTFTYLTNTTEQVTVDYGLPFRFRLQGQCEVRLMDGYKPEDFTPEQLNRMVYQDPSRINEIRLVLQAVK